nr:DUF6597 domain-containing transcriptional factor [Dickeya dadantii]
MRTGSTSPAVRPLQPWFVINAAEDYLKKALIDSPIAHFYCFSVAREQPVTLAVPDGSVDILFNISGNAPFGRVCGSTEAAQATRLSPGERYFGVRFMPGVMPAFLDLSAGELAGQEIAFQDAAPAPGGWWSGWPTAGISVSRCRCFWLIFPARWIGFPRRCCCR